MRKAEINEELKALLANEELNKMITTEVENLLIEYEDLEKTSQKEQLDAFVSAGGDSIEFSYELDEFDQDFHNLKGLYIQKKEKKQAERTQARTESLAVKKEVIDQLQTIIKTDVKNLGKHFQIAKELQEKWKAAPSFPGNEFHELEVQYKAGLDQFYYNANIIREAIELDYQKNFEAKAVVLEKIKGLSTETDAQVLERKINQYEKEWFRIGPVKKDIREENKQELLDAIESLQPLLDKLYESQQELLKENLTKKIAICEQLNALLNKELSSPGQFQKASDQVKTLQANWKEIGRSEENDRIWEVFKGSCDTFFDKKREFFKHLADNRKEHKKAKVDLIRRANELKDSTDWKNTSNKLIALQKEWKTVGPAHPAEDQKLWLQFRSACDAFFNARKVHYANQDKEYEENLKMKQLIIDQVKEFQLSGNTGNDVQQLREFEKQFQAIGFVPFKQKDKIHKAFYNPINALYSQLKVDRAEQTKMRFTNKIKSMAQGKKPDRTLDFERNKIRQRMDEIKQQLVQYENNFNISDESNPLVQGILKNIKGMKREYENLQVQLQLIKDAKAGKFEEE